MSSPLKDDEVLEFSTPGSQRIDAARELNNQPQIDDDEETNDDIPQKSTILESSETQSLPEEPTQQPTPAPTLTPTPVPTLPEEGVDEEDHLEPVDESHLFEYPTDTQNGAMHLGSSADPEQAAFDTTQGQFTSDELGNPIYSTDQFHSAEPQLGDDDFHFDPDPVRAADAKARGNKHFSQGKYEDALECYAEALLFCPEALLTDRILYHNNKCAAHVMLHQWEDVIFEATAVVSLDPINIKGLSRRAKAYEAMEQYQEAIEDYKQLQQIDPKMKLYAQKVDELTKKNEEKFEKQKAEMVDKLKGWGDSVLGWFGMSTNNFQFVQDPSTGSYSVNFNQNPGSTDGQQPQQPQQPQPQQPGGGSQFNFSTQRP